jgi:DNA-binding NtrC family response regulator
MTSRTKILVVDDHVDLAENIAEILESAGHDAVIADSGEAALALLARESVDAVITDFRLPGISGADLIAELRRRGVGIPAIVMSAYTDDDTIDHSQRAGAMDVLGKPVDLARLARLVDGVGRDETTVLVVDDNRAFAENVAEALQDRGYDARVSTSAGEALASPNRPRAAILDYRLPDATGVDLAARLTSRDPRTQVLFVTGYAHELKGQLGEKAATARSLMKPVDVGQLLAWVEEAIENAKAKSARR